MRKVIQITKWSITDNNLDRVVAEIVLFERNWVQPSDAEVDEYIILREKSLLQRDMELEKAY